MSNIDDNQKSEPEETGQSSQGTAVNTPISNDLQKENEDLRAGWQRARADYQNLQRETAEQKKDWAVWSELRILEEFIPVYDNFKKAFNHQSAEVRAAENGEAVNKEQENWKLGIKYIMKQFGDILKAHGIEEIKTAGEQFNPVMHESVGEETADVPEHSIIREIDGGYMMKGKVIKAAKVIVAKQAN